VSQYGDGDYCSVWEDRWVTARKEHVCFACAEAIVKGQRYHVTFSVYDGRADTTKRCARCQAIFEHLSGRMKEHGDEEEFCDAELKCGHEYEERWNEPPPEHIAALAFWLPGDPLPAPPEAR
jgi:hypothetical protein